MKSSSSLLLHSGCSSELFLMTDGRLDIMFRMIEYTENTLPVTNLKFLDVEYLDLSFVGGSHARARNFG